jgi:D-alanyl-D-alanine-carboxypeptidase/D-alanyl-D-alanine-endopeptidase
VNWSTACAFALVLALGVPFGTAAADGPGGDPSTATDLQSVLDRYVAANDGAAVIVGVVDRGVAKVYRAKSTPAALDDATVFEIGSVTKTFTATLLASMVRAGEVKLDDPVQNYLPPGFAAPQYHGKAITLLALAEQNSGLPGAPTNLDMKNPADPWATYTPAMLQSFLAGYTLTRAPGDRYEYSNVGVGLLGNALAYKLHGSYAEAVRSRVLAPLGMGETTAILTPAVRSHLIPGFTADGEPQGPWTLTTLAGAGGLYSSLRDMLTYLKANLGAPDGPLGPALAAAQEPRYPIGLDGALQIGLVWQTNVRSGITWHNGQTGGYHAYIGFNKARHSGVVLLANYGDINLDAIGVHALVPGFPVPAPRVGVAVPQARLDALTGAYELAPGAILTVTRENARLYVQLTGQSRARLFAASPTEFFLRVVDAQLTFELGGDGKATAVTLHQNGQNLPAKRIR